MGKPEIVSDLMSEDEPGEAASIGKLEYGARPSVFRILVTRTLHIGPTTSIANGLDEEYINAASRAGPVVSKVFRFTAIGNIHVSAGIRQGYALPIKMTNAQQCLSV